jgi:ribonuclease Z
VQVICYSIYNFIRQGEVILDIFFLGTGAGIPAKLRNVTSIALKLLEERGSIWLFDAGEATQHQILHTSIKPRRIEKIFITHLHGDHIYGLPGLLASRSFQGGESEVTVFGPKGLKEYITISLSVSQTYLKYPLKIVEIAEGVIFEDEQFIVEARLLEHGIPSYGYRIVEKDRPGKNQRRGNCYA